MSFVDDNLMQGEEIVYRANLHWAVFIIPAILTVSVYLTIIGIPLLILAFISYKTAEFAVTNKRVLIKVGLIRRSSLETLLQKVEGIHVEQGIFGRLLDYGTIVVKGTGGTSNPFKTIEAPFEFRKKVQEQVEIVLRPQAPSNTISSHKGNYCVNCGTGIQAGSKFCNNCGKQVG